MWRKMMRSYFDVLEARCLLTSLVADIDSDGDLDVVRGGAWYKNFDGFGNFDEVRYSDKTAAAVGDLDGDDDLDIATVDGWFENVTGHGDFDRFHLLPLPVDFSPSKVKLIDVGNEGDLDIVLYNDDRAIHFDHADGTSDYQERSRISLDGLSDVGDVDNDGTLDAIRLEGRGTWLYLNSADGQLEPILWYEDDDPADHPGHEYAIAQTDSIQLADVNSDGWLDVVTADSADGFFDWWARFNDGSGRVGSHNRIFGCFGGCTLQLLDANHDGHIDAVSAEYGSDYWSILANDGLGQFRFTIGLQAEQFTSVGDLNGDGVVDFVTQRVDWIDGATTLRHSPGSRWFQPPSTHVFISRSFSTDGITLSLVADLVSDGAVELIVTRFGLIEYESEGRFYPIANLDRETVDQMEVHDVDADGDLDLVVLTHRFVAWIENIGDGEFNLPRNIMRGSRFRYMSVGDINGDGLIDIVAATRGAGVFGGSSIRLAMATNEGGNFEAGFTPPYSGKTVRALAVGDVDKDGDDDVFASIGYWVSDDRSRVYEDIWWENVDGVLTEEKILPRNSIGSSSQAYAVDLNGDGFKDLILNDHQGTTWYDAFAGRRRIVSDSFDAIGDLDDDGDADLIMRTGNQITWRENSDGAGRFLSRQPIGVATTANAVHVGDIDHDGDNDVIATGFFGDVTIFEKRLTGDSNNDGVFSHGDIVLAMQHGQYDDGIYRNSTFETGDWNGDGEFDSEDFVFAFTSGTFAI